MAKLTILWYDNFGDKGSLQRTSSILIKLDSMAGRNVYNFVCSTTASIELFRMKNMTQFTMGSI